MCGIFGIQFSEEKKDLGKILKKAAEKLTYRGYDSVGFATINGDNKIDLRKDKGKIDKVYSELKMEEMKGSRGIIQLRWATFGIPSKENAQPHLGCKGNLVSAHNGNIVNTNELIKELTEKGHIFTGENDGEALCHQVEDWTEKGDTLEQAVIKANKKIDGHYACVCTIKDNPYMVAVKQGSSLFLGIGGDFVCVSSDLPSILEYTKEYIPLMDGEFVVFDNKKYEIKDLTTGDTIEREPIEYNDDIHIADKGEFPHYMLKEIYEQPSNIKELVNFILKNSEYKENMRNLFSHERVFIIGAGSSYNASIIGSFYLQNLIDKTVIVSNAGEFIQRWGRVLKKDDAFLLISQSGETKDVMIVLDFLKKRDFKNIFSMVNVTGSTLHMRVPERFPVLSNLEIGVAATKTFTNQVVSFLMMGAVLGKRDDILKELSLLPDYIEKFVKIYDSETKSLAEKLINHSAFYFLGYGISYGGVIEGALKVKELAYIPGEGFYSSEFKHGPLALISDGQPVVFLSANEDSRITVSHINEIKVRKGRIYTIAPENEKLRKESDVFYPLNTDFYYFIPILGVIFFQLLAYNMAVLKGENPDTPRNLSKSITVD
jgi:glucosamine--fructose-6-phosphate aminotransferase (isomerizing)